MKRTPKNPEAEWLTKATENERRLRYHWRTRRMASHASAADRWAWEERKRGLIEHLITLIRRERAAA